MGTLPARNQEAMDSGRPPPIHLRVRLELPQKEPREFDYDFEQAVISLGRDPSNDVQVPLTTVSRHHARVFFERGDYFLEDLGSTHGTKHNDRDLTRGEKRLLRSGDRISIISFHINFEVSSNIIKERQPGERTEQLVRDVVEGVLQSLESESEHPSLRIMNGPDEGRRFTLSDGAAELVIGRSPDCDITLDDNNISRRHCLVKRSWHGFTAQDLGSRNGVLVNSQEINGPQMLRDGDEIQIGGVKLTFIDPPSRFLEQLETGGESSVGGNSGEEASASALPDETPSEFNDAPEPEYGGAEEDLEPVEQGVEVEPFEPSAGLGPLNLPEEDRKALEGASSGAFFDVIILVVGVAFLILVIGLAVLLFL